MRKMDVLKPLGLAAALLWLGHEPAQAYLDPGTGSILLQMIIGGIAGGVVVLKLYWAKVTRIFSKHPPQSGASIKKDIE